MTSWVTTGLNGPVASLINGNYIYISNYYNGSISKINLYNVNDNTVFATLPSGTSEGLAFYDNQICVAGTSSNTIYLYELSGTSYAQITSPNLNRPYGLLIIDNTLYVANFSSGNILQINLLNGNESILSGFSNPYGLTYDGSQYIYVSNRGNQSVSRIDTTDNSIIYNWLTIPGLNNICGLTFNTYLYVTYYTSGVVAKVNVTDKSISYFPTQSSTFNSPDYIVFDSTYAYICNFSNSTIDKVQLTKPPCFKEGSKILTDKGYKLIEDLRKGDLVKTLKHDYLPIVLIGKSLIYNSEDENRIKNRLYNLSKDKYPELTEDLVLTGCHSILMDILTKEQEDATLANYGAYPITDGKVRLETYLDNKAVPYPLKGTFTIYHLALENENYFSNYGIWANGLLVESCSKRYLTELSGMELIE